MGSEQFLGANNAGAFDGRGLLGHLGNPPSMTASDLVPPVAGLAAGYGVGLAAGIGADIRAHGQAWRSFETANRSHLAAVELVSRTHAEQMAAAQQGYRAADQIIVKAAADMAKTKAALPLAQVEATSVAQKLAPLLTGYPDKGFGQLGNTVFVRHWMAQNPVKPGESNLLTEARTVFGNESALFKQGRALATEAVVADRQLGSAAFQIARLGANPALPLAPEAPAALRLGGTVGRTLLQGGLVGGATIGADYAGMWGAQALGCDKNSLAYRFLQPKGWDTGLAVGGYLGARALGAGGPWAIAAATGGWVVGHTIGMW